MKIPQFLGHDDATHADPLDDADELELELAETQLPALHVMLLVVQSMHITPPVPHVMSAGVVTQVLVGSQHPPAHDVLSHVAPLLLPLALPEPLLLAALPELLALLVYMLPEPDPLEPPLLPLPLPLPLVLRNPEAASLARNFPNSPGATPPLAQATKATAPARATSVSRALEVRRCIGSSVRRAHRQTTQYDPVEARG